MRTRAHTKVLRIKQKEKKHFQNEPSPSPHPNRQHGHNKCSQHHGNQPALASLQNDPLSLLATPPALYQDYLCDSRRVGRFLLRSVTDLHSDKLAPPGPWYWARPHIPQEQRREGRMSHQKEPRVSSEAGGPGSVRTSGNNFDLDQKFLDQHMRPRVVTPRLGGFQPLSLGII